MRRVLITGGSGGIGSAIARNCAARDRWPIVAYARNEQGAARTVRTCGAGQTLHSDLLESEGDLGAWGELDSIVLCAGLYSRQRTLLALASAAASGRTLQSIRSEHPEGHLLERREIGRLAAKLLADEESRDGEGQLVFWDLRDSREPVWTTFQDAPLFNNAH